jgi:hypothetical protein
MRLAQDETGRRRQRADVAECRAIAATHRKKHVLTFLKRKENRLTFTSVYPETGVYGGH